MAILNVDEGEFEQTTLAEFTEDLILQIVARLPIKSAVQCYLLNKNYRRWISQPNFLPHYSTVFHCYAKTFTAIWQQIRATTVHQRRSVTLEVNLSILASCNGLLLLRLISDFRSHYYIFNPTTGGIMAVEGRIEFYADVGLAVPDTSCFKLVAMKSPKKYAGRCLQFSVFAPSLTFKDSGEFKLVKSKVIDFDCGRRLELTRDRPVYAHGCVYWLADGGGIMVAFDVEEEKAKIIDGPAVERDELKGVCKWFGFADGVVQLVYMSPPSRIVMCRHDYRSGEWRRVKRDIALNERLDGGAPVFFDGRRLLLAVRGGGGVYGYDLVLDSWEKFENLDVRSADCKLQFYSYTSSFAQLVSDTYLNEENAILWEHQGKRNALRQLQKLLSPAEISY